MVAFVCLGDGIGGIVGMMEWMVVCVFWLLIFIGGY
jgi:hypothetical protein